MPTSSFPSRTRAGCTKRCRRPEWRTGCWFSPAEATAPSLPIRSASHGKRYAPSSVSTVSCADMADVTFAHVAKSYGDVPIIDDLNLTVDDGELMVLVGPSGCGKSTALRMIAGLEDVTAGTISIGGRVVNALPPKERDIAMVFQNYALYPHMSVRENLEFGLRMRRAARDEIAARVARAA